MLGMIKLKEKSANKICAHSKVIYLLRIKVKQHDFQNEFVSL